MTDSNSKPWYRSKVIWYAILSGVATIVTAFMAQYPEMAILGTINTIVTIGLRLVSTQTIQ